MSSSSALKPLPHVVEKPSSDEEQLQARLDETERLARRDRLQVLVLKGENDVLRGEVAELRQQIARLQADNTAIQQQTAREPVAAPAPDRWRAVRRAPIEVAKLILPTPVRAEINRIIGRS